MSVQPIDRVVMGLLTAAAVLLLANLDNGYLWQDEAETAVLARNTLMFGYPKGFDGRNYIEIPSFDHGPGHSWIYSPWLQFYVVAAAFALLGEATWTARLPFALLGWLSIVLAWRLVGRLTPDRRIQRLVVALLTCSVPFLLHMRQCRYYALTTALLLGVCLAYTAFLDRPSRARAMGIGVMLVLLFHANFGTFVPAAAAIGLHHVGWGVSPRWRYAPRVLLFVTVLTLPWICFAYRPAFVGVVSWDRVGDHLEYYIRVTNKYLVPLAAMILLSVGGVVCKRRWLTTAWERPRSWSVMGFLGLMIIAQLAFLMIPDQRHMRYVIPVLPLLVIVEAWWLAAWWRTHRLVGSILVGCVLLTNALQSTHPRVPLADFLYEVTHSYTGPMEGVVAYLRAHAKSEDVVKIPYDDRTVMFYTNLRVERPSRFAEERYPEWIVLRRDWLPPGFLESAYFQQVQRDYERIELEAPDLLWQNREDPGSHHFRTVTDAPHVVVFRRRGSADGHA